MTLPGPAEIAALAALGMGARLVAARLPLIPALRQVQESTAGALRVVRAAKVSDHWKERALLCHARWTLAATLVLTASLAGLLGAVAGGAWVMDAMLPGFMGQLLTVAGTLMLCVGALLPSFLPRGHRHV